MSTKPGMPYSESRIARFLTKQIESLQGSKSQREIASEIGYDKPNMISMFKRGECKVPLDKIPALAKSIEADPAVLFKMAMEQYWPENYEAIGAIFGTVVTRNEVEILQHIRDVSENSDPKLTPRLAEAITSALLVAA